MAKSAAERAAKRPKLTPFKDENVKPIPTRARSERTLQDMSTMQTSQDPTQVVADSTAAVCHCTWAFTGVTAPGLSLCSFEMNTTYEMLLIDVSCPAAGHTSCGQCSSCGHVSRHRYWKRQPRGITYAPSPRSLWSAVSLCRGYDCAFHCFIHGTLSQVAQHQEWLQRVMCHQGRHLSLHTALQGAARSSRRGVVRMRQLR